MNMIAIITPTHRRPFLLKKNIDSIKAQSFQNYMHDILRDKIGIGIAGVHRYFHRFEPCGDYVWRVDDDNEVMPDAIKSLTECIEQSKPDAVIVDIVHGERILPEPYPPPVCGGIDAMNIVVSKAVWMKHRESWGEHYSGDFDFIKAVWDDKSLKIIHLEKTLAKTNKISHGQPE